MRIKLNVLCTIFIAMSIIISSKIVGHEIKEGMIASQGIKSSADVLMSDNEVLISNNDAEIEKNKTISDIWRCDYE
jgi:hypothetical protein